MRSPMELATRQRIDLFPDWEQQCERLAKRIAAIASLGTPAEKTAPAAAMPNAEQAAPKV